MIDLLRNDEFMRKLNLSLKLTADQLGITYKTYSDGFIADYRYAVEVEQEEKDFWLEVLEDKLRDVSEQLNDERTIEKIGDDLYWQYYDHIDALTWINEKLAEGAKDRLTRLFEVEIDEDKSKKIDEILKIDQNAVIYELDFDPRDHIQETIERIENEIQQDRDYR